MWYMWNWNMNTKCAESCTNRATHSSQCHHWKSCHPREYEYDMKRGITKNVVGPIKMIAIQQRLQSRHRADRAREEERNRDFEVEAHFNPTEPTEERIDVEEDHNPYMYHPSMDK
ncbi:hypothetical protein DSO57_1002281 [Entomophthora muscae]|uniref:Uncharacterized protein n=1 Tax=Entomophthora muscae TaxID=34485 RepID=A0ACC2TK20_9FUNG|nr:hypothetical protein DSO57_1002281 [Entomophthora muscae]